MVLKTKEKPEEMETVTETAKEEAMENAKPAMVPAAQNEGRALARMSGGGRPAIALDDARDQMVVEFGTLPRLKAEQGAVVDQDGEELGSWIEMEVYSFNSRFVVTPNDKDAPADLAKFSLDGEYLDDDSGLTVREYLAQLKEEGWDKASVREYYEVVGPLLAADGKTNFIDEVIQVQLSPSARKSFDAFRMQMTFKIARGKAAAGSERYVRFTATKRKRGSNSWTQFVASPAKEVC